MLNKKDIFIFIWFVFWIAAISLTYRAVAAHWEEDVVRELYSIDSKAHVDISTLDSRMYYAVLVSAQWKVENTKTSLVITSTNDSKHVKGSKHYSNLAFDIRTKDVAFKFRKKFYLYLLKELTPYYEIIYYKDHIHVEYAD